MVTCEYSEQNGVEAGRRLAMSELRRQFDLRRRRRQRLHQPTSFVVVQVVSGRAVVVAASPDRLDGRRRRRIRRRDAAESVDSRSTRRHSRALPRGAAHRRWTRLVLRRRQSLAPALSTTVTTPAHLV